MPRRHKNNEGLRKRPRIDDGTAKYFQKLLKKLRQRQISRIKPILPKL